MSGLTLAERIESRERSNRRLKRKSRKGESAMWRGLVAIVLSALAFGIMASGCESDRAGITGQVVDSYGKPIPGARVSVVVLPPGGIDTLVRMVREGESLWGWHFNTDSKGEFRLEGIPTGYDYVSGYTPPQVYTTRTESSAYGSAYGTGGYATGSGYGSSTTRTTVPGQIQWSYQPGQWLGFVVIAPGYLPNVGLVNFPSPRGKMTRITLAGWNLGSLEIGPPGVKVTLVPLGNNPVKTTVASSHKVGAAEAVEGATGNKAARVIQERTIEVPVSVITGLTGSGGQRAPSWKKVPGDAPVP